MEAKVGIWIVNNRRPEHVAAINWLNESASADFYLVKLEAIKIEESLPAALFTEIVGPSKEAIKIRKTKGDLTERHLAIHRFWTALLEIAKKKTKLHTNISPGYENWVSTGAGLPNGLSLQYSVRQQESSIYLQIDTGDGETSKAIFEHLLSKKNEIEKEFDGELEWNAKEGRRSCYIGRDISIAGWGKEDKWADAHEALIDTMIKLEQSLRPHLDSDLSQH